MRPAHQRQRGQTLVIFAVVMTFFGLGMLALICDTAVMFNQYDKVGLVAEDCVQAAISQGFAADRRGYYRGGQLPSLDRDLAQLTCNQDARDALGAGAPAPQVTTSGDKVTVTVSDDVTLPVPLWASTAHVSVTRNGQIGRGG